jgi:prepilin-type processing-associated H-X9-DG protein
MSTFWPMNLQGADSTILPTACDPSGSIVGTSASSFHPGGCNFAFGDGGVRFIKNTVSSWNSLNIQRDANCLPILPAGTQSGIYQALSTKDGNEMVVGEY